jgi:3D (Asp-Asp-Asp) domain-containing protein
MKKLTISATVLGLSMLIASSLPVSASYEVKQGDTLSDIADEHKLELKEISELNPEVKDINLIFVGQELRLEKEDVIESIFYYQSNDEVVEKSYKSDSEAVEKVRNQAEKKQENQVGVSKQMTVEATAYTAYCSGCSGITATGIDLRSNPNQKVIAVDPSVIPLGSRVWVEGYGEAIAGDTGGAIKGNKIDIFVPTTEQALNFGRKSVSIKILSK